MSCTPEVYKPKLKVVESVARMDIEELMRTFTQEERLELWNRVREAARWYILECSPFVPREVDRLNKGIIRLAQLKLAYTFREEGVFDDIVRMFRDEEYEILRDFEEYKILDALPVDEVVEFIARREGKVYEIVTKYYEKQYNMLDKAWGKLIGDLAYAFEVMYRRRREKIEEAVARYAKRFGLIQMMREVEEAVKKVVEASDFRKKVEEEVERRLRELGVSELEEKVKLLEEERKKLLDYLSELEEKLVSEVRTRAELEVELEKLRMREKELEETHNTLLSQLEAVRAQLREAWEKLQERERELEKLREEYSRSREAAEALRAEAENLRRRVEELKKREEEYERALETLRAERDSIKARLEEVERAIKGVSEGRLVTAEEALALEEQLIEKLRAKLSKPFAVYSPLEGKVIEIKKWSESPLIYSLFESKPGLPCGKGISFALMRGAIVRKPRVVIEAVTLVHVDAYRERGYDVKPVNLAELVDLVSSKASKAEEEGYYLILVVSSPTGFTSKALEYVAGKELHRTFTSKYVTVYLVDPVAGKVYHHPADEAAIKNKWIAEPMLEEEKIAKVVSYMKSQEALEEALRASPAKPFLLASDVSKKLDVDRVAVRQAFARLEEEGLGKVVVVEGEEAFIYDTTKIPTR